MARCKECLHYEVCAKEGRLVKVDEHTWDEYNKLDDVEQFCTNYFAADVVPKSEVDEIVRQWKEEENCWQNNYITELRANEQIKAEVAREIFEEIDRMIFGTIIPNDCAIISIAQLAERKKKYTEGKSEN